MSLRVEQIETPAVLIDLDALDGNLRRMAEIARQAGVKLRPHTKTHKSVWIAKQQLQYGASGITVAKLGEAEVMADSGIDDILIAYPVIGKTKLERLGKLMQRAQITVSTDNAEVARGLSELGEALKQKVRLYVDVNTGLNRCGLDAGGPSAALVKEIAAMPGIEVVGLMTHAGHAYRAPDRDVMRSIARDEAEGLVQTKKLLEREGIEIPEISVGTTPTSQFIGEQQGVTEMRPGAYVFGDGNQKAIGLLTEEQCAMTVQAMVISAPRPGTVIVDAGSKTITSDLNAHRPGYGTLRSNPEVYIEKLSEEHGLVRLPEGLKFNVGDVLQFLPNHCCPVTNLHDKLFGIRGGLLEREIKVDARGMVR